MKGLTAYRVKVLFFIALFVSMIALFIAADQAHAAPEYCPEITSIESHNGALTVHWSKTDNPPETEVEVNVAGTDKNGQRKSVMKKCSESDRSLTLYDIAPQRLPYGTEVDVMLRATFQYSNATHWTDPETAFLRSGKGGGWNKASAVSVKNNTFYSGETNGLDDEEPPLTYNWYKFRTSSRTDSKYRLTVYSTYSYSDFVADAEIVDGDNVVGSSYSEGSDPVGQGLQYNDVVKLSPQKDYYIRVSGTLSGYYPRYGVEYKVKIEEIVASPAKVSLSSFSSSGKNATVRFNSVKNASGYQVAFKKRGGSWKTSNINSCARSFSNLGYNNTYYVKVRAYRKANGKTYYGAWSTVKSVTVKKPAKIKLVKIKPKRTYKSYDVTNNGKRDRIKVKIRTKRSEGTQRIKLYVNGKKKKSLSGAKGYNAYLFVKGKKSIIIICSSHAGGGSEIRAFQYSNRKFHQKRIDIPGCYFGSISKANNGLQVTGQPKGGWWTETFERFSKMPFYSKQLYDLEKGKLVKLTPYPEVSPNNIFRYDTIPTVKFFAWEQFRCASSISTIDTKDGMTVKTGDSVTFKNMVYRNGEYYYRIEVSGRSGWIKDSDVIAFGNDMS